MGRKKKEALTQFNQENILKAAKSLFETKGIAATTMDEIAKVADYSKSTMYVYFKSKDEILMHIILEQMKYLKEILENCMKEESEFRSCFYRICKELRRFQAEHPVFYELLLEEIRVEESDLAEENVRGQIYLAGEEVNGVIERALQKGIEQGYLRSDIKIVETVFYLWSSISQVILFANKKRMYFKMRLGIEEEEYMNYAFGLILKSIEK